MEKIIEAKKNEAAKMLAKKEVTRFTTGLNIVNLVASPEVHLFIEQLIEKYTQVNTEEDFQKCEMFLLNEFKILSENDSSLKRIYDHLLTSKNEREQLEKKLSSDKNIIVGLN